VEGAHTPYKRPMGWSHKVTYNIFNRLMCIRTILRILGTCHSNQWSRFFIVAIIVSNLIMKPEPLKNSCISSDKRPKIMKPKPRGIVQNSNPKVLDPIPNCPITTNPLLLRPTLSPPSLPLPPPPNQTTLLIPIRLLAQHIFLKSRIMLFALHPRIHIFGDAWSIAASVSTAAMELADFSAAAVEAKDFLVAHLFISDV